MTPVDIFKMDSLPYEDQSINLKKTIFSRSNTLTKWNQVFIEWQTCSSVWWVFWVNRAQSTFGDVLFHCVWWYKMHFDVRQKNKQELSYSKYPNNRSLSVMLSDFYRFLIDEIFWFKESERLSRQSIATVNTSDCSLKYPNRWNKCLDIPNSFENRSKQLKLIL